uniref:Peptidase S1 domain-containing protein n=1 Tax=Meloidogyne enterolobii TaxID=390850 RepID=A0A6V7WDV0_MELEN|nr:unnamed protein product [Meloidogyne enterolobii]
MFTSTLYAPEEWSLDDSTNTPFYYDAHRCGMPIHIDNHGFVRRVKRFRPPHLRHHRHFNRTHEHVHRKVMGGFEAEEGDMPWAVSIHAIYGGIDEAQCSGTLISKRHVISAAHCFFKYEATTDKTGKCM